MGVCERDQLADGVLFRHGVRVRNEDVVAGCGLDPHVDVRGERERPLVLEHADAVGYRFHAARQVGDHEQLVDLRSERGQRALQLVRVPVRDDDRRDRHRPSTSR
jgi:hypothetical protein